MVPWGMGVARRTTLVGLVKLKKGLESQTPRPVTGNLEVEPMETKIFSGAELEDFQNFPRGTLRYIKAAAGIVSLIEGI